MIIIIVIIIVVVVVFKLCFKGGREKSLQGGC